MGRVLIACEFSGIVRDAFAILGHETWSCDFLESERQGNHYCGDVLDILNQYWDLLIAHPTCTFMCNSGVKHLYKGGRKENGKVVTRWDKMFKSCIFFKTLIYSKIKRKCLENPIMHCHAKKLIGINQSQIIQPWQFGHGEIKATCLWLHNLPFLEPTEIVAGRVPRVHYESPGSDRWKNRSRTYEGIARAMADQWGKLI